MRSKRILLLLFIIISLVLLTFQSNKQHFLPSASLGNILNALQNMKSSIKIVITSPFKRMLLREEENKKLMEEISKLRKEYQECKEIYLENKKLRELLTLKQAEQNYVTTARIIARTPDQWSNTHVIDHGSADGIEKDMIAVTEKGLVGKISGVTNSYSYLLLLTDINFSVAARMQENRTEGIVSGTGFRKCQMKYVPSGEEVKKGDIVITSGLDSLFPPGIPIGYVANVSKKDVGIFQGIEVIPFADNKKIEIITIVKRE
jgi:rod shape-determining protein MreC